MNIKTRDGANALMNDQNTIPHWVSFWINDNNCDKFEIHFPWWITGYDMNDRTSICVAIYAHDVEHAKRLVEESFDDGFSLDEWRFADERSSPNFIQQSGRFTINRDWMVWPE